MGYLNRSVTPVHRAQIRALGLMQKREMVKKSVAKGSNKKTVYLELINQHLLLFSDGWVKYIFFKKIYIIYYVEKHKP